MMEIEILVQEPLFEKFSGVYIDCLHPVAWEWMEENVGPCNFERGSTEIVGDLPPLKSGHWDIIRRGFAVFVRLPTEEHAVIFKLRWSDIIV